MKKSVIVLILVIYIASIAIVGFFGAQVVSYNNVVLAERLEITNEDLKTTTDSKGEYKYIVLTYEDGLAYSLAWKIYPENAKQEVEYVYDKTSDVAFVNAWGGVVFNKKGTITIQVRAGGGVSTVMDRVKIIAV